MEQAVPGTSMPAEHTAEDRLYHFLDLVMHDAYAHFLNAGKNIPSCLATILRTGGSTPQVSGVSALFGEEGLMAGTLGGGILEAEAGRMARNLIASGESRLLDLSLDKDVTDEIGGVCGGRVLVLLDGSPANDRKALQKRDDLLKNHNQGLLITRIRQQAASETVEVQRTCWTTGETLEEAFQETLPEKELMKSLRQGSPELIRTGTGAEGKPTQPLEPATTEAHNDYYFIEPFRPASRLVIAGAGHVGRALADWAARLDFHLTIIDNRPESLDRGFFPEGTTLVAGDAGKEISRMKIDSRTFIVIMTQGHQHDAEALRNCIDAGAAYIGMIGSRRKVRRMRDHFIEKGWATPESFDRVHAPIGLDIHAFTVDEIALSVAAELVRVRNAPLARRRGREVRGLVLAAGRSTRMGRQKLLMPVGRDPLIVNVLDTCLNSRLKGVTVVLGSDSEAVRKAIGDRPVETVFNPGYEAGMLSSIICGVDAITEGAREPGKDKTGAIMVLLGDQPDLTSAVIDELITACSASDKRIIQPVYKGKRGHPVIIDSSLADRIRELDPGKGLRELMETEPEEILEVPVDHPGILKDIDTPEDYQRMALDHAKNN